MIEKESARPIYEQIRDELLNRMERGVFNRGEQIPTEAELCSEFGVSRTSVRKAIESLQDSGIVRRIPGKGSFIADGPARDAVGEERSWTIAFVENEQHYDVSFYSNHVWQVLSRTLQSALGQRGYTHYLSQIVPTNAGNTLGMVRRLQATASVTIIAELIDESLAVALGRAHQPATLLVEPSIDVDGVSSISFHNQGIGRQSCKYLHDLGHRNLAFIAGPEERKPARHRKVGFFERARALGIRPDRIRLVHGDWSVDSGYKAMQRILAEAPEVTAVCCANDFMALGAANAVFEAGKSVPRDVSLLGVDDALPHRSLPIGLTTFRFPIGAVVDTIVERIERLMSGTKDPVSHLFFEATLVERDSCRRL